MADEEKEEIRLSLVVVGDDFANWQRVMKSEGYKQYGPWMRRVIQMYVDAAIKKLPPEDPKK